MIEIIRWAWSRISSGAAAHSSKILLSDANTLSFKLIYPGFRVCNTDKCDPPTHTHTLKENVRWEIKQKKGGILQNVFTHYSNGFVAFSRIKVVTFHILPSTLSSAGSRSFILRSPRSHKKHCNWWEAVMLSSNGSIEQGRCRAETNWWNMSCCFISDDRVYCMYSVLLSSSVARAGLGPNNSLIHAEFVF